MDLQFPDTTFVGPPISDLKLLELLPPDLKSLLQTMNGFIAFGGGFHLRGICGEPDWHSLELFWKGQHALSKLYPGIQKDDIPFGQDCVGDQFFLRNNEVHRLRG